MVRTMTAGRRASRWSLALSVLLGATLLILAIRGVSSDAMLATIRQGRPLFLVLAFLLTTTSFSVRALRWRVLLGAEKSLAPITVFWAIAVGYLGNYCLPARAGDLIRSALLGAATRMRVSYVLATTLVERIVDAAILVMISLMVLARANTMPGWLVTASKVMALIGLGGLIGIFVAPRLEGTLRRLIAFLPLPGTTHRRLDGLLEGFLLGMRALQHPNRAAGFLAFTGLVWMLDILTSLTVAAAFQHTLTLPEACLLLAALGLASAAPSTPGYVGIYQFVAVTVLTPFGYSRAFALVYIISFQAVIYAVVILWGIIGLWQLYMLQRTLAPVEADTNQAGL